MRFNVILEPEEEGGYNVTVPALDGCFTQGDTEEEALKNAKEAIICYLEGLEKLNQIKTKPGGKNTGQARKRNFNSSLYSLRNMGQARNTLFLLRYMFFRCRDTSCRDRYTFCL